MGTVKILRNETEVHIVSNKEKSIVQILHEQNDKFLNMVLTIGLDFEYDTMDETALN